VILTAPGKLVAEGSPVALKSLGQGYNIQVSLAPEESSEKERHGPFAELLNRMRALAPHASMSSTSPQLISYHLKTKDLVIVEKVLQLLDDQKVSLHVTSYDVLGTSIEDIFLDLTNQAEKRNSQGSVSLASPEPEVLQLTDGYPMSPLSQAITIFYKRALVARRSWLTPLLTVLIPVAGCSIPLVFMKGRPESCVTTFLNTTSTSLYLPTSPLDTLKLDGQASIVTSPPNIAKSLGETATLLRTTNVADNESFIQTINQDYRNLSIGGISLDLQSGRSLLAWEAAPPGISGPAILNLATNILYNHALNESGNAANDPALISANYQEFPVSRASRLGGQCIDGTSYLQPVDGGTLVALRWVGFFGASMVCLPCQSLILFISRSDISRRLFSRHFLHYMFLKSVVHPFKPCTCRTACQIRSVSGLVT
jgi:ATP-binding cassette, subfamily A (ABC1), member 3